MSQIIATDAPLYWAAIDNGQVIATGLTDLGNETVSALQLVSAPTQAEVIAKVQALGIKMAGWPVDEGSSVTGAL